MKRTHSPSIIILWSIIYFSAIVPIFSFSKKYLIIKACEKFLSSRDVKCFCFLDSSKISELKINGCSIHFVSPSLLFQCPFITSLLLQTKSGKRNNVIFNTLGKIYIYSSDNNLDQNLIVGNNIELKAIPSKIYEIYKEVVEGIKRGE